MPTVLITGTSTGFGQLTTELLAARGWRVFATMRELAKKDSLEHALLRSKWALEGWAESLACP